MLVRGDLGRVCLAVVDTNDDGAFHATVVFHRDDDGVWRESEWHNASVLEEGWKSGVGYAYGRGEVGWWLHLEEVEAGKPLTWLHGRLTG